MRDKLALVWRVGLTIVLFFGVIPGPPAYPQEGFEAPDRVAYISDHADILTDKKERELNRLLERLEQESGAEVSILTVPTTEPLSITEYGDRVAKAWNLDMDDPNRRTLLFVIALEDGRLRLMTSKGLEPDLSDPELLQLRDRVILPAFNQKRYTAGIEAGIQAIAQHLQREAQEGNRARGRGGLNLRDILGIAGALALVSLIVILGRALT